MSAPMNGSDEGAARPVPVLRLETLRHIEALVRELQELHDDLLAREESDGEGVRDLLHVAGVMTGVWLDDLACRFAETEHNADELFAQAWQFVDDLQLEPGGFRTREDPALFTTLRGSAAGVLARLWVNGYLMGPVPEDTWPNEELTVLILRSLEHQADAVALNETLDHRRCPEGSASQDEEQPGTGEEPDEP
ncbi:hypothetical protein ACIOMM_36440 [Streptomyces sp. NPDC087908]|uniref:hypothetical protein n=1 Tax=Streptomyces sp. NPDC087908 TaxID=3365820 RepID=UPI00381F6F65